MVVLSGWLEVIVKGFVASAILFAVPVLSALLFLNFSRLRRGEIPSFASGLILSTVFLRIVPESFHNFGDFFHILMFLGIVISIILDKLIFLKDQHFTQRKNVLSCWACEKPFRATVVAGLGLHYISDGFFLGGFLIFSKDFLISLLPVIAHKIVDGLILSFIYSDQNKKRSIIFIVFTSAFNILGVALASFSFHIDHIFAPVSAGILVYIAIHDFIPVLSSVKDFIFFGIGSLIVFVIINALQH